MRYLPVLIIICWSSLCYGVPLEFSPSEVFYLTVKIKKGQQVGCVSNGGKNSLYTILGSDSETVVTEKLKRNKSNTTKFQKALKECKRLITFPECKDHKDNDGDGKRDFPQDPDCSSETDSTEQGDVGPLQIFGKPFTSEYSLGSLFDHQYPLEFIHTDGVIISSYGESHADTLGVDGHQGYDFTMDEGTPILAAADGVVTFAGAEDPFFCPLLNQTTSGNSVILKHTINGEQLATVYAHFSSISVTVGQTVTKGTQLGISGNTGCSTGPHLHFDVQRILSDVNITGPSLDPFGWNGSGIDPWTTHQSGTTSTLLWAPGEGPKEFRFFSIAPNPNTGDASPVAITKFRWAGWEDDQNPNNEFVELTLDTRYSNGNTLNLSGFKLRNLGGESFTFPRGFKIKAGLPVRIYSGSGTNSTQTLYWKRTSGAWDNDGDCAQLSDASNTPYYYLYYGVDACLTSSTLQRSKVSGGKVDFPKG